MSVTPDFAPVVTEAIFKDSPPGGPPVNVPLVLARHVAELPPSQTLAMEMAAKLRERIKALRQERRASFAWVPSHHTGADFSMGMGRWAVVAAEVQEHADLAAFAAARDVLAELYETERLYCFRPHRPEDPVLGDSQPSAVCSTAARVRIASSRGQKQKKLMATHS